jgi:hypothetical protein
MMSARGARWEAKQAGAKTYYTGIACGRGHLSERITATGTCLACRRLREQERYAANPEPFRQTARKYIKANRQMLAEKARVNRAKETAEQRQVRLQKSSKRAADWRVANPQHLNTKLVKQRWKLENPSKVNAQGAKRRAALLLRMPNWLTEDDLWMIEQAYDIASLRSKMLGFSWHVDHIYPLQGKTVSGLHTPLNLQVIPWSANIRKANRLVEGTQPCLI